MSGESEAHALCHSQRGFPLFQVRNDNRKVNVWDPFTERLCRLTQSVIEVLVSYEYTLQNVPSFNNPV